MKIAVALHQVMDLGGIINHTEQMIGGLKDIGHSVDFFEMCYSNNATSNRKDGNFLTTESGIPYSQKKGWNFPSNRRFAYKTTAGRRAAIQRLSDYDIVIWTIPVPSKGKQNLGNYLWDELYDLPPKVKQIAFIHDGNAENGYPYINRIADRLVGIACVHHCALHSAEFVNAPRALIVNPQKDPVREVTSWAEKSPGFVNMQTFKAWKHVHELIEAIRYMPAKRPGELREIAGMGIEYQYLTSEDKCKENYIHDDGVRFWGAALLNGMTHHDYWDENTVDQMLREARILVDPSWSKKYSQKGGHYNRVVVDAMMRGAIPVARRKGMGTELFQPGIHYVEIPESADAQQYADVIMEASNMSAFHASQYREDALEILPLFDRRRVANLIVDLAFGNADVLPPKPNKTANNRAEDMTLKYFGML